MNDKASVTKEQNARNHAVLEGLMKLPENRECADCRSNCRAKTAAESAFSTPEASATQQIKKPTHSTSKDVLMAGLEDLFNDSSARSLETSDSAQTQMDVKQDILNLFSKTSIASPYAVHQQQMAAFAHRQSLATAAQVSNAITASQANLDLNKMASNVAVGSSWSAATTNSQTSGMLVSTGAPFAGFPLGQIGGAALNPSPNFHAASAASSVNTGALGGFVPYHTLVSPSLSPLSANSSNGSTIKVESVGNPQIAALSSIGQSSSGGKSDVSTSVGATYDFSSLMPGALSKH